MKNNKKIFDSGIYFESLRQLRLFTILALAVYSFEAVMIPVGNYISYLSRLANGYSVSIRSVTLTEMHPILYASFIVVAPIIVLIIFNFLDSRKASDFYHSIPHTRACVFNSMFAAAVTCIVGLNLLTTLLSVVMHLVFPQVFLVNLASVGMMFLSFTAASLLVAASVAVAMSITGTVLTNIIVSLLILFVPRMIITVIIEGVAESIPILVRGNFLPLLDSQYNIVTNIIFNTLTYQNTDTSVLTSWGSLLYTFFVAVLYTVAACLLFRKRKSESAQQSAPNRILQAVYRITLTMVICIFICRGIWQGALGFQLVVYYGIAIIIYFAYELITTKKWKNLLRAIPGLGIVAVLNIIFIGILFGVSSAVLSVTPDAAEIRSVRIVSETNNNNYFYYGGYYDGNSSYFGNYAARMSNEISITDNSVKEIVSESLKDNVKAYRENNYHKFYNGYAEYSKDDAKTGYVQKTFAIKTVSGATYYRSLYIKGEDETKLVSVLEEMKEYKEIYMNLPKADRNTISSSIDVNAKISGYRYEDIYEILVNEVKELNFSDWYEALNGRVMQSSRFADISFYTTVGMKNYYISVPVNDLTPKAADALLEAYHESTESERKKIKDIISDVSSVENIYSSYLTIEFKRTDGIGGTLMSGCDDMGEKITENKAPLSELLLLLETAGNTVPTHDNYCKIYFHTYGNKYNSGSMSNNEYTVYFALPDGFEVPDSIKNSGYYYEYEDYYYDYVGDGKVYMID